MHTHIHVQTGNDSKSLREGGRGGREEQGAVQDEK